MRGASSTVTDVVRLLCIGALMPQKEIVSLHELLWESCLIESAVMLSRSSWTAQ